MDRRQIEILVGGRLNRCSGVNLLARLIASDIPCGYSTPHLGQISESPILLG